MSSLPLYKDRHGYVLSIYLTLSIKILALLFHAHLVYLLMQENSLIIINTALFVGVFLTIYITIYT